MPYFASWASQAAACNVPAELIQICQVTLGSLKNAHKLEQDLLVPWFLLHVLQRELAGAVMCDLLQLPHELETWLDVTQPAQQQIFALLTTRFKEIADYPQFISRDEIDETPLIQVGERFVYLRKNYMVQLRFWQIFSGQFLPHAQHDSLGAMDDLDGFLTNTMASLLAGKQGQPALLQALSIIHKTNFLILTGGPGTGKTWTLSLILQSLIVRARQVRPTQPLRIFLAAPTGRAAARMTESLQNTLGETWQNYPEIPHESQTVHKLLRYIPNAFTQPQVDWLYADVVAIDEASMLDVALFTRLFSILPPKTKLILLGDPDQLPSVELGAIFVDMLLHYTPTSSTHILRNHVVRLTQTHRSENVHIARIAEATLQADMGVFQLYLTPWNAVATPTEGVSVFNIDKVPIAGIIHKLKDLYRRDEELYRPFDMPPKQLTGQDYQRLKRIFDELNALCVLSARRDIHPLSVDALNKALSHTPNFPHASPIMVKRNLTDLSLTNGERGIILQMGGMYYAVFCQGATWQFIPADTIFNSIDLSYVMTIHKSQGSEFKHVFIILPDHSDTLMTRSLLFTGITRAKKSVTLLSSLDTLEKSLQSQTAGISCLAYLFNGEDPCRQMLPVKRVPGRPQLDLFD